MIDCLGDAEIVELLQGKLSDERRAAAEAHLSSCDYCARGCGGSVNRLLAQEARRAHNAGGSDIGAGIRRRVE